MVTNSFAVRRSADLSAGSQEISSVEFTENESVAAMPHQLHVPAERTFVTEDAESEDVELVDAELVNAELVDVQLEDAAEESSMPLQ